MRQKKNTSYRFKISFKDDHKCKDSCSLHVGFISPFKLITSFFLSVPSLNNSHLSTGLPSDAATPASWMQPTLRPTKRF